MYLEICPFLPASQLIAISVSKILRSVQLVLFLFKIYLFYVSKYTVALFLLFFYDPEVYYETISPLFHFPMWELRTVKLLLNLLLLFVTSWFSVGLVGSCICSIKGLGPLRETGCSFDCTYPMPVPGGCQTVKQPWGHCSRDGETHTDVSGTARAGPGVPGLQGGWGLLVLWLLDTQAALEAVKELRMKCGSAGSM